MPRQKNKSITSKLDIRKHVLPAAGVSPACPPGEDVLPHHVPQPRRAPHHQAGLTINHNESIRIMNKSARSAHFTPLSSRRVKKVFAQEKVNTGYLVVLVIFRWSKINVSESYKIY